MEIHLNPLLQPLLIENVSDKKIANGRWRTEVKKWGETTLNMWNHGHYSVWLRGLSRSFSVSLLMHSLAQQHSQSERFHPHIQQTQLTAKAADMGWPVPTMRATPWQLQLRATSLARTCRTFVTAKSKNKTKTAPAQSFLPRLISTRKTSSPRGVSPAPQWFWRDWELSLLFKCCICSWGNNATVD